MTYVLKNGHVPTMVNVFVHRKDTYILSLLVQIFIEFLSDNSVKDLFLEQCDIVFAKNLLKHIAHPDPKLKANVLDALRYILENPMNHRFIARVDIKNMINVLKINSDFPQIIYLTLQNLGHLTSRDEFLSAFLAERLEQVLIEVISKRFDHTVNLEALNILGQLINSVYGADTAQSLYKMENNFAIETLSGLCIPPTNDNVINLFVELILIGMCWTVLGNLEGIGGSARDHECEGLSHVKPYSDV